MRDSGTPTTTTNGDQHTDRQRAMPTDAGSEDASSSSGAPSRSPTPPEALALGREKRATAGNKLRALLDAEFQEEEIFAEEQNDEEFVRAKSDDEEDGAFLSDSSSESEGAGDDDEEAGERQLEEERKRSQQAAAAAKKRKAMTTPFTKPVSKRPRGPTAPGRATGILASKPASTASSVSNRRISFDPNLLASRRSSRKLTVQITNETHERIISAAARRATLPAVPKRERTPPLTQEERLAQAVLTEEENKMSLQRIIQAEEERARKRREKLEALRRKKFDEPLLRFISRRRAFVEEVSEDEKEVEVEIVDEKGVLKGDGKEGKEGVLNAGDEAVTDRVPEDENSGDKMIVDDKLDDTSSPRKGVQKPSDGSTKVSETESPEPGNDASKSTNHTPKSQSPISSALQTETERMNVDDNESPNKEPPNDLELQDEDAAKPSTTPKSPKYETAEDTVEAAQSSNPPVQVEKQNDNLSETKQPTPPHTTPKSPPPYHQAYYTSNTLSFLPLPNTPLPSPIRETFFTSLRSTAAPKPKPAARCPITGLGVRYKDPLTGVGYYDIHAFAILREVARTGGRYVWCDEGGWFVGESGTSGRPAKGVPDGWFGE